MANGRIELGRYLSRGIRDVFPYGYAKIGSDGTCVPYVQSLEEVSQH